MIDIKAFINNIEKTKNDFIRRGLSTELLENIISLDKKRKDIQSLIDDYREKRNQLSKEIGKNLSDSDNIKNQVKDIKNKLVNLENEQEDIIKNLKKISFRIPNMADENVPDGNSEDDNITLFESEIPHHLQQKKIAHWDLKFSKNGIDFSRGVKLSGSRFYVLFGQLAQLQRALIQYLLHTLNQAGFNEVQVPYIVHQSAVEAAGQLPKFAENLYRDHLEDFWLIPTAEVPLTGLHKDEILSADSLPILYCAHSPCFRREKASAGKDGRGMKRGHQFDKVEMYAVCKPDQGETVFEKMLAVTQKVCDDLELPYRHKQLCTGDLGFAASKTIDVEVWASGCQEWLEVSSISLCRDFQARRAKIRFKNNSKKELCYTLNGSCMGIPRTLIAIIENNIQDNIIHVPKVLQYWMKEKTITL